MGNIASITDLVVLAHSITIQVTLQDGYNGWTSPIHCAAFPLPHPMGSTFDWNMYTTVTRSAGGQANGVFVMPDITTDAHGQPIQGGTKYKVMCGIQPADDGPSYKFTEVTTPDMLQPCETNVQVNMMDAPRVLINGQTSLTLSGVVWKNFHHAMAGMHAYEVPTPLPAMSEIKLRCCSGRTCEFFFALYNCEACTGPKPAGLAQTLLLDGWESGACSPQFGDSFKTTAFRRTVDATDSEVTLTYNVPHKEILSVYALEGSIARPWCVKPHGPFAQGVGCGVRCPSIV